MQSALALLLVPSLAAEEPDLTAYLGRPLVHAQLLITLIIEQITHYPVEVLRSILPRLHSSLKKAYDRVGVVGQE